MKSLAQLLLSVICAAACTAFSFAQEQTSVPSAIQTTNNVHGRVVQDPGGQGIRKVKVSLRGRSGPGAQQYEAVTDDAGNFTVDDVHPGIYFVQLERSGYATARKANRTSAIEVTPGHETKDLVFHMVPAGVISGKIVDLEGDPLQGISVMAIPTGAVTNRNMGRPGNAATNDLGEYRIADLPAEKYNVQAVPAENQAALSTSTGRAAPKDRQVYATTYFPGTLDARQAIPVEVPAGGTATANFGMQITRVYRVSGTILGLSVPKPQAQGGGNRSFVLTSDQGIGQILLVGKNGQEKQQNVREDGTFEFNNVPAGTYHAMFVSLFGFLNGQAPSLTTQTFRTPIEVNGSDVVGLQLQLEPGGTVSGGFRMDGSEKIDWKELSATLVPTTEQASQGMGMMMPTGHAVLNEDGSFEIKDVPPGECQLAVGANSEKFRDYYTKSVLLGGRDVVDTGFSVSSGMILDVLVSAKGASVEGTVLDASGKPVPGANVGTVPSSGKRGRPDAYQFGQTDEQGHFMLRGMNPGEFLVLAFEEIHQDYRSPEFAKKYEAKGEKIKLEEGAKKNVVLKIITEEDDTQ